MRIDGLTPQQHRVARMVADGLTDKHIATVLNIGVRAVHFHMARIAKTWGLDESKNRRVEIVKRFNPRAA